MTINLQIFTKKCRGNLKTFKSHGKSPNRENFSYMTIFSRSNFLKDAKNQKNHSIRIRAAPTCVQAWCSIQGRPSDESMIFLKYTTKGHLLKVTNREILNNLFHSTTIYSQFYMIKNVSKTFNTVILYDSSNKLFQISLNLEISRFFAHIENYFI